MEIDDAGQGNHRTRPQNRDQDKHSDERHPGHSVDPFDLDESSIALIALQMGWDQETAARMIGVYGSLNPDAIPAE